MVEKLFSFTQTDEKVIERIISDENLDLNHMVLRKLEALPQHYSNSNVYMLVIRGTITLQLDEQKAHDYPQGSIITIPYKTKMNVSNQAEEVLEFFVVKAPSPSKMSG